MNLAEVLKRQYDMVWGMLDEILEYCPEDEWRKPDDDYLTPSRLAYHAIEAVDFHLDDNPAEFDSQAPGFDWENSPPRDLPDRSAVKKYAGAVRSKAAKRIENLDESGALLNPEQTTMNKYFPTGLDHVIYALRHLQYHLGQIDTLLHQRGIKSPEWQ